MKFRITYVILAIIAVIVIVGALFYIENNSFHVVIKPEYAEETFSPIGYKYIFNLTAYNKGPLPMSATLFFQVGYLNNSDHQLVLENYTIPVSLGSGQELHQTIKVYLNVSKGYIIQNGVTTPINIYSMPQIEKIELTGYGEYGWRQGTSFNITEITKLTPLTWLTVPSPPNPAISGNIAFPSSVYTSGVKYLVSFNNTKSIFYPNISAYFTYMEFGFQKYNNQFNPDAGYITLPFEDYNVTFYLHSSDFNKTIEYKNVEIIPGTSFQIPYAEGVTYNMTITIEGKGVNYTWYIYNMKYVP